MSGSVSKVCLVLRSLGAAVSFRGVRVEQGQEYS